MYSVAPLVLRKALADVQIGRYTIPAGTAILIHVFAMHNTSHNFERHTEFLPVSSCPPLCIQTRPHADASCPRCSMRVSYHAGYWTRFYRTRTTVHCSSLYAHSLCQKLSTQ